MFFLFDKNSLIERTIKNNTNLCEVTCQFQSISPLSNAYFLNYNVLNNISVLCQFA